MLICGQQCPHSLLRVSLDPSLRPHALHARLGDHEATFILESREGPDRMARYSFVGFAPAGIITWDDGLRVQGALPQPDPDEAPLAYLRRVQALYQTDDHDSPFVGGLVGTLGYGFARLLEPVLDVGPESWPRMQLGLYLDGIVFDHHEGTVTYVSRAEDRSHLVLEAAHAPAPLHVGPVRALVRETEFSKQVEAAQQQIRAGEAFQIVLSRAYTAAAEGALSHLYDALREAHAVPYLYHVRFAGRELLGASPEMLVRVRSGQVETFPIAGTRPMTGQASIDDAAGKALLTDPKETAEHAMLVDLARNDLNRVCTPGSVQVADFQRLVRFRHVQHLVSHVTGKLADHDALDALAAVFPAGTVSGAPKIRAMQHIETLERRPRGAYAGAVAYLSFNGDFDSAIAIRSLCREAGRVTVQAGAGIVQASDPHREYEETCSKASAMLQALEAFQ